jgi:hypothetical protein
LNEIAGTDVSVLYDKLSEMMDEVWCNSKLTTLSLILMTMM